jgi:hypothetical protein
MKLRERINEYTGKIPLIGEALTTEINGKNLVRAALAAGLVLSPNHVLAGDSVEVMVGNKSTTIDVKLDGELAPRTGFFVRNRTNIDDGSVTSFAAADIFVNITGGLDAILHTQYASSIGVVPRLGLQYFAKSGDVSAYLLGTAGMSENPDGEVFAVFAYNPKITDDLSLVSQAEFITNFAEQHNFSIQRLRLGVETSGYSVGAATDLMEAGPEGNFGYNVGGFVKKEF